MHWQVTDSTYVCSAHFGDRDIRTTLAGKKQLVPGAVPSQFSWSGSSKERKPPTDRTPVKKKAGAVPVESDVK